MVKILTAFGGLILFSCMSLASTQAMAQETSNTEPPEQNPESVLTQLDEPGKTQLPILGRRFRIDYQIDQITLVFFREPGSAPVILIQPDGSKWYATKHPPENVTWHSQAEFDMITIDKPQPGPWQVSGRVLPESSAMVVSDVKFHPEPLQSPLYVDETVKVSGTLTNAGRPIETPNFRDVITLDVIFISSNNPDYDNFGVDPKRVGEFRDDGRDHDEAPGDGTFTGSFRLDVRAGEYRPTYRVSTPLLQRSEQQALVVVEPLPVQFEVAQAKTVDDDHQLLIHVDEERIEAATLVVNGKTLFPNADVEDWSLNTAGQEQPYQVPLPNYAFGRYVVELDVFATDIHGREFKAQPEAIEFIANEPPPPEPTAEEQAEQARLLAEAREAEAAREKEQQKQQLVWRLIIIIVINVVIIGAAIGAWWWLRRRKQKAANSEDQNQAEGSGKPSKDD